MDKRAWHEDEAGAHIPSLASGSPERVLGIAGVQACHLAEGGSRPDCRWQAGGATHVRWQAHLTCSLSNVCLATCALAGQFHHALITGHGRYNNDDDDDDHAIVIIITICHAIPSECRT